MSCYIRCGFSTGSAVGKRQPAIVCATCDGTGWIIVERAGEQGSDASHQDCGTCGGTGRIG